MTSFMTINVKCIFLTFLILTLILLSVIHVWNASMTNGVSNMLSNHHLALAYWQRKCMPTSLSLR